jgi:hypothetical protein
MNAEQQIVSALDRAYGSDSRDLPWQLDVTDEVNPLDRGTPGHYITFASEKPDPLRCNAPEG